MIWGMITSHRVGRIVRIEGNLNKELYHDILQDNALGTYHEHHMNLDSFYFQQDNDPKHTSKIIKAWIIENDVDLLNWPPNSPDISIIENLWDHQDCQVQA